MKHRIPWRQYAVRFDVLVMAVGVRPNVSLLKDIGGKTNRGIITDERCRTSIPDIYAAGDCCESMDISSGEPKVMALLPMRTCGGMRGDEHVGRILYLTGLSR